MHQQYIYPGKEPGTSIIAKADWFKKRHDTRNLIVNT